METFFALLVICAGNSPVPGEFPAQRPVTRSFDVFYRAHYDVIVVTEPQACHLCNLLFPGNSSKGDSLLSSSLICDTRWQENNRGELKKHI